MGAHVASLVVAVDGEVETEHVYEVCLVISQHGCKVGGPVPGRVDGLHLSVAVQVTVDYGRNSWQLGDEVHGIFIRGLLRCGRGGDTKSKFKILCRYSLGDPFFFSPHLK